MFGLYLMSLKKSFGSGSLCVESQLMRSYISNTLMSQPQKT